MNKGKTPICQRFPVHPLMWILSFSAVAVTGLCVANAAVSVLVILKEDASKERGGSPLPGGGEAVALLPREVWMPIPGGAQGWGEGPCAELVGTTSPQQEVGRAWSLRSPSSLNHSALLLETAEAHGEQRGGLLNHQIFPPGRDPQESPSPTPGPTQHRPNPMSKSTVRSCSMPNILWGRTFS